MDELNQRQQGEVEDYGIQGLRWTESVMIMEGNLKLETFLEIGDREGVFAREITFDIWPGRLHLYI